MAHCRRLGAWFRSCVCVERGQGSTEYALILALVAIVVLITLTVLSNRIYTLYGDTGERIGTVDER